MALYHRHSAFFRQSLYGIARGDQVDGSRNPDRRAGILRRVDISGVADLARSSNGEPECLGRTAGCSLSADRPPTALGVHERSVETFAFFHELQTVFLNPAIDFPAQIDVITQHDRFDKPRQCRLPISCWGKEQ